MHQEEEDKKRNKLLLSTPSSVVHSSHSLSFPSLQTVGFLSAHRTAARPHLLTLFILARQARPCAFRALASHTRASARPTQSPFNSKRFGTCGTLPPSPDSKRPSIPPASLRTCTGFSSRLPNQLRPYTRPCPCFLRFVSPVLRPTVPTKRTAPCDHVPAAFAFVCYLWVTNP